MSTPMSQVYICSGVRLDNRYQHSIYFASQTAQREYFAGKVVKTFSAYSHHRRNWELKVEASVAEAQAWNYLYIINPGVKPYYYFVNKVEYVSDTTVKLWLELDVLQTNLFDNTTLLPCFVERQHTATDAVGEHTVPEGLEMGPYWNYHVYDMEDMSQMGILAMSSMNLCFNFTDGAVTETAYAQEFNGVYSGLGVYAFNDLVQLEKQLKALDEAGKSDAIVAIWMYPKNLVRVAKYTGDDETDWADFDFTGKVCARVMGASADPATLAVYANYSERLFGGYTPKNNKLYTHPYNLLYVTGNQGDKAEYKFEHFATGETYNFNLYGAISPDAGVKLAPAYYNIYGANTNYDEGVTLANFPPCAWDSDTYKVWLAQNYNQMNHGVESAVGSALLGVGMAIGGAVATAATGGLGAVAGAGAIAGGIGSLYSAYNQIGGIMAQKEDAKAQPPQARGTFSSTVNVASGRQTFSFYYKCIRKEYAQQIDDYFTMFGYKLNRVQTPNINARPAFTYVKTVGCKVTGEMSNEDITQIERIFDNGITFWKDGDKIGDYSQANAPVKEE